MRIDVDLLASMTYSNHPSVLAGKFGIHVTLAHRLVISQPDKPPTPQSEDCNFEIPAPICLYNAPQKHTSCEDRRADLAVR